MPAGSPIQHCAFVRSPPESMDGNAATGPPGKSCNPISRGRSNLPRRYRRGPGQALAGHHGALTTNAAAGRRVSAQLTVHATTLRLAIDNSLAAARDAVHGAHGRFNPVRVDVVDEATFQAELAGVSRQRARELPNLPYFPPAVTETSSQGPLRVCGQVANWIQGWERRAGRPPTPPSNRPTTLANYPRSDDTRGRWKGRFNEFMTVQVLGATTRPCPGAGHRRLP